MLEQLACKHGVFDCPDDEYIGKALALCGEYSEKELQVLLSLLDEGDTVIEVGAHVGTLTVPLARKVGPSGKVIAYEPQNLMHDYLKRNVESNGLGNVSIWQDAIGAHKERRWYAPFPSNTGGVPMRTPDEEGTAEGCVETFPLDWFAASWNKGVALLKIDVEGMEPDVLVGARRTIIQHRPIISIENDRPINTRKVVELLQSYSYRIFRFETPLFNPDNHCGYGENLWPDIYALNLLCIPEERADFDKVKGMPEIRRNQWAAVCRFGGVGDNLIAAAALPGLVRQGNKIEFITSDHFGEVFAHNPWIDKLSICKEGDQPGDGNIQWQTWFEKRSHEYIGGLYHLSHTVEGTLAFFPSQTAFWWRPEVRRVMARTSYIDMAQFVTGSGPWHAPLFYASAVENARARDTKKKMGPRVVGWVLRGSRFDKTYPFSAYAIARLIKLGIPVMMSGAPGPAFELAKVIQEEVIKANGTDDGLHLALSSSLENPNWPVRRGLAQLQTCDLVIGPDTGGMWAVAFEPMPKIMLLSHASPENITKHWTNTVTLHADTARVPCWPCHRLHDSPNTCTMTKHGPACMSDISVELLLSTAKQLLGVKP